MAKWSYGITTVASRIASGLLQRTLDSLAVAGFPEPRLFIDGIPNEALSGLSSKLQITCRNVPIRIYGNFHLGLNELFIREPHADLYAMFQDDFITYPNLREYLESCEYPNKGYWNLYTFKENLKPTKGWYPSNGLGKGAVALVFDNAAVKTLLNSPYWINRPAERPSNPDRTWKFVDGGVVEALKLQGYKEYVHNPSLVQHTGDKTTLGNPRHPKADSFKGEAFDASTLIKSKPSVKARSGRIGLVGYNVATGLGELNRQLAEYADIYRWLIQPHPKLGVNDLHDNVDCMVCPTGVKLEEFLNSVDIVVFCERPYYSNLLPLCRKLNKRSVCIPMQEWMPPGARGWPKDVDLFLCPTKHCFDQFRRIVPCLHFPWPVDTERFKFRERTVCNQFLFINGNGGTYGRKGGAVVREVIRQWPDIPLVIRDQTNSSWGVPNLSSVKENHELYGQGDVLISPHSVDGLGLEGMESLACGMPVISTIGKPWDEVPAIARILSRTEKKTVLRPVDWYVPDPIHLKETCQHWLGRDISSDSLEARAWAEARSWSKLANAFDNAVRNGSRQ